MSKTDENTEKALETQIGNLGGPTSDSQKEIDEAVNSLPTEEEAAEKKKGMLGQKLTYFQNREEITKESKKLAQEKHLSKIGESIGQNADIREGWLEVDRSLLGDRDVYYPADWQFRIKPATVEAIRNWSTIDENSANSIDVVFDEILKSCLAIMTPRGPLPWSQINAWDRFFFVLLIREYTFQTGEAKVSFKRDCSNCESEVEFELNSQALMYDMPGEDVMKYYDRDSRSWTIFPSEFDVEYPDDQITLYLPTREKDANIKAWVIDKLQQDKNAKIDRVFIKFLPWMLQKISKDTAISKGQIRKAETEFKSWDVDMFELMDQVITNISVTPGTDLIATCPSCGEEVTAPIQFPNGISALFHHTSQRKKFGSK
jgi:hypothetical protein